MKAFERQPHYETEREAYRRIRKARLQKAGPFNIPELVRFDDDLWIIEMTVVNPPFMLDFAGAYIDRRHPFDDETMEAMHEAGEEVYGKERWEIVQEALSTLFGKTGIRLIDVHPGNVRFENDYS
ncbi:MAG: hypothetical protein IT428_31905 [Planctomycetaceae bacterium]|nr:hypothetical protein [Planctomycetaceae bacterium]